MSRQRSSLVLAVVSLAVMLTACCVGGCIKKGQAQFHGRETISQTEVAALANSLGLDPSLLHYQETVGNIRLWILKSRNADASAAYILTFGTRVRVYHAQREDGYVFPPPSPLRGKPLTRAQAGLSARAISRALWFGQAGEAKPSDLTLKPTEQVIEARLSLLGVEVPYPKSVMMRFERQTGRCMEIQTENWQWH